MDLTDVACAEAPDHVGFVVGCSDSDFVGRAGSTVYGSMPHRTDMRPMYRTDPRPNQPVLAKIKGCFQMLRAFVGKSRVIQYFLLSNHLFETWDRKKLTATQTRPMRKGAKATSRS